MNVKWAPTPRLFLIQGGNIGDDQCIVGEHTGDGAVTFVTDMLDRNTDDIEPGLDQLNCARGAQQRAVTGHRHRLGDAGRLGVGDHFAQRLAQ